MIVAKQEESKEGNATSSNSIKELMNHQGIILNGLDGVTSNGKTGIE